MCCGRPAGRSTPSRRGKAGRGTVSSSCMPASHLGPLLLRAAPLGERCPSGGEVHCARKCSSLCLLCLSWILLEWVMCAKQQASLYTRQQEGHALQLVRMLPALPGCCQGGCSLLSNMLPLAKAQGDVLEQRRSLRQQLHPRDAGELQGRQLRCLQRLSQPYCLGLSWCAEISQLSASPAGGCMAASNTAVLEVAQCKE